MRLLIAEAFLPFAYGPVRGASDEAVASSRAKGLRAAEMAERLGRPDLASAALDGASSGSMIVGRYGDDLELVARRLSLLDRIDDAWETGDVYAMASWSHAFVGNYQRGWDYAVIGNAQMEGTDAEGLLIHALAWQAYAGLYLGRWAEVTQEVFPRVEALLGDRAVDPPYFTQNLFGAVSTDRDGERRHRAALAAGPDPGRLGQRPWRHGRQQRDERRCVAGMGCAPPRGPRDGGRDVARVRRQTHPWSLAVVAGGAGDAPRRSRAP